MGLCPEGTAELDGDLGISSIERVLAAPGLEAVFQEDVE